MNSATAEPELSPLAILASKGAKIAFDEFVEKMDEDGAIRSRVSRRSPPRPAYRLDVRLAYSFRISSE